MSALLSGKHVAILATDGFEPSELKKPRRALEDAGARTSVVSPKSGSIRAWAGDDSGFGESVAVDLAVEGAVAEKFDALVLPGGVMNPDRLRMDPDAVAFVRSFFDQGKPVAAICHGPWMLIEADVVQGRKVTSYPSLRRDLINAGAHWIDEAVVTDRGLVTSRKPEDLPLFTAKLIEEIAEGIHTLGIDARPGGSEDRPGAAQWCLRAPEGLETFPPGSCRGVTQRENPRHQDWSSGSRTLGRVWRIQAGGTRC